MHHRWLRFAVVAVALSSTLPAHSLLPVEVRPRLKADWALVTVGTPPRAGEVAIPCGDLGVYSIVPDSGPPSTPNKVVIADGFEKPLLYPPGAGFAEPFATWNKTGTAPWTPCLGGSCFDSFDTPPTGKDWIAVIDWNEMHGWAVGGLIRQVTAANIDLALYRLDPSDPNWAPYSALATSDLHVLEQLCRIAQAVDGGVTLPPLVINMSFGRENRPPVESRLDDEVARVVHHLANPTPKRKASTIITAAGNHREVLFPAALTDTIAVGSLDHRKFDRGLVGPTWETPQDFGARPAALLPSSGLCLTEPVPSAPNHWPVPPGSSFSAALLTSGLAPLLADQQLDSPISAKLWYPVATVGTQGEKLFTLSHGGTIVGTPRGSFVEFLTDTLSESDSPCSVAGSSHPAAVQFRLGAPQPADPLPWPSFIDILPAAFTVPTPDSDPCVPCSASQRPHSAIAARASVDAINPRIDVDLANANPLPGLGSIVYLYLRWGGKLYRVGGSSENLSSLALGQLDSFSIDLTSAPLETQTEQPSLLFVTTTPYLQNVPYWTSIPIVLVKR